MENNEGFSLTYSAAQQREIEAIRKKYLPQQEDKLEQLRRLHQGASRKARASAITVGTVGALTMGTGMSLAMTELGQLLGTYQHLSMLIGIIVGIVGMLLVALAYPVYDRGLKRARQKIAPQILQLTDELMK